MRHIFIFSFLILTLNCYSQDYMDIIVAKACDCSNNISDTIDTQEYNLKIGSCLIEASRPYKKQLKKDYKINIDALDKIDGEKLGKLIGVKMISICPHVFARASTKMKNNKKDGEEIEVKGIVAKIENDFFVVFSLKDEFGKTTKYYWMTLVDSKLNLIDQYDTLLGKTINISYKSQEFFDPKIKEYKQFNIITKIEII